MPTEIPTEPTQPEHERIRELLEQNLELTRKAYIATEKMRRYLLWNKVFSIVKLAIVVVPLVLGYLYFKPYVQDVYGTYRELFGLRSSPSSAPAPQPASGSALWQQLERAGMLRDVNAEQRRELEQYLTGQ